MRPVEKDFQLQRIQFREEFRKVLLQLILDLGLRLGRLGFAQLDHHVKIFELLFRFEQWLGFAAKRIRFLDDFLSLLPVVPKTISRHQRIDFREAFLRARYVKETSANAIVYRLQ